MILNTKKQIKYVHFHSFIVKEKPLSQDKDFLYIPSKTAHCFHPRKHKLILYVNDKNYHH